MEINDMSNTCNTNFELSINPTTALTPIISGEERCAPSHTWGAGVRSHFLIHYVIQGSGVFYCGTNKYKIQKGQLFVIYPGTIVKYQADDQKPWHYAWVGFYGDEAKEILTEVGVSVNSPVLSVTNGAELLEVLRAMPSERCADMKSNLAFCAHLYEFMSLLVENKAKVNGSDDKYLTNARRYIKAHYYEDITVDSVAAHIGISRKYLFAIFKKALDISPKEYILSYRLTRACEFLKDENITVGNVAYSVGYKDPLTFSKMFKLKTGLSPTEYREQLLKK